MLRDLNDDYYKIKERKIKRKETDRLAEKFLALEDNKQMQELNDNAVKLWYTEYEKYLLSLLEHARNPIKKEIEELLTKIRSR